MPKINKPIPNFPGYTVDVNGNVYSKRLGTPLKPRISHGYKNVGLYKNNKRCSVAVHKLVLDVFVGLCPDGMECRHLDGNKKNNNINNLKWGTRRENAADRILHGINNRGENSGVARLTEQDVRMIIYMCRTKEFTQQEIAEIYKVSQRCVSAIINKKRWKHIWSK